MRVYLTPTRGETLRSRTDKDGRYAVTVPTAGRYGVVIAIGKAHTYRTVVARLGETTALDIDIDLDIDGGEVIQIDDERRPKPTITAKPQQDQRKTLPYSAEAIKRDAWARAWLLLDVDETGKVKRVKLLKRPGFALEKICLEEAFRLTFEPGRDADGQPMKTYVLWSMEWPSWGYLAQGSGTVTRQPKESYELHVMTRNPPPGEGGMFDQPLPSALAFPSSLSRVPCYGSGPLNLDLENRAYRDCALPKLATARELTWITPQTAATAVAEMALQKVPLAGETPRGRRWPGYVGFGVTGALGVATVLSFMRFNKYADRVQELTFQNSVDREGNYGQQLDRRQRWQQLSILAVVATVASGGASLWLWNRHHANFSVAPSLGGYGGSASFEISW